MHGTLAPKGFLPVPLQKTQLIIGSDTSVCPDPLHTMQSEMEESNAKGSFPVPSQKAHLIVVVMAR
jgi:hypothetical protein